MESGAEILIVEPSEEWLKKINLFLSTKKIPYDACESGKEAQLKIYKTKYRAILVDIAVQNTTSFELVRYIKMTSPGCRIIFTVDKQERLTELGVTKEDLRTFGVSQVLLKPYNADQLIGFFERDLSLIKTLASSGGEPSPEKDVLAGDDEFTRIDAKTFVSGSTAVFDLHVRIKNSHYVKVLYKGESFDRERVKKYLESGVTHFYFRTKDRLAYVSAMNNIILKIATSSKVSGSVKEDIIRGATEKYVEELFTKGLRPEIVDEGKKLCQGVSEVLYREPRLRELITLFEKYSEGIYGHSYLVMFYSAVIGRSLNWAHIGTIENLGMGAMLHDIGKMKLPRGIGLQPHDRLGESDYNEYKKHTELGVEMVSGQPNIHSTVVQIISQHHETVDGLGFPHRLTGPKIFPMAKVVGLADRFVNLMMKGRSNPTETLKKFLKNSEIVHKYDGTILKSFAKAFINNDYFPGDRE